jgi:Fe-S cluster biogenesis protein NfuA
VRVARLDRLLRTDGGGLELIEASGDGIVRVRFSGFCTSCPVRPLTTAATVRPLLLAVEGVKDVEVAGGRISAEAHERLAHYMLGCPVSPEPSSPIWREQEVDAKAERHGTAGL